jgi:beta-mannosidase
MESPTRAVVTFSSPVFQHRFAFDVPGRRFECSDNHFELYPGEAKEVEVTLSRPTTAARLRRMISHRSLADTYE